MSNEEEDFDFEENFEAGEGSIGEVARSPLVKIGVVVVGLATVIAGLILFGGDGGTGPDSPSVVRPPAQAVSETPGEKDVSPEYAESVETENVRRTREAIKTGGSAFPTPINKPPGKLPLAQPQTGPEDPLQRWRRIQQERQEQESGGQTVTEPELPPMGAAGAVADSASQAETISALAEAMSAQMGSILESQAVSGMKVMKVTAPEAFKENQDISGTAGAGTTEIISGSGFQGIEQLDNEDDDEVQVVDILLPAGTIEYAQLMTEANSDTPSPVMAQVVSGPLSGSRMLGTFETREELLVLTFNSIVIDGVVHSTEALALDPDTASAGLVTDIDRRYFRRIVLPAAAAFIEGLGSAVAEAGSSSVTVEGDTVIEEEENLDTEEEIYKGLEEAASKVGEVLDEEASGIQPQIKVRAGVPMALLFVQPVTDRQNMQ